MESVSLFEISIHIQEWFFLHHMAFLLGRILPQAFSFHTEARHVQVAAGIRVVGEAAWRSCQRLQVVHLPDTVVCLRHGVFRRCYLLRAVMAPGCRQFGIKAFEACCSLMSLTQLGATQRPGNQLAPQAQFRPRAFEKCTALRHLNMEKTECDPANSNRCLPPCCFLEAGIVSLSLPPDFNWVGPAACARCQQLQIVDLSRADIDGNTGLDFCALLAITAARTFPKLANNRTRKLSSSAPHCKMSAPHHPCFT